MVRPAINLELYKAEIIALLESGTNINEICDFLQQQYDIKVHYRTLSSRLRDWGIRKNSPYTVRHEPEFLERVKYLFLEIGASEAEMLQILQKEGFQVNARTLRRVRTEMGLVRRTDNPVQKQAQKEMTLGILLDEIQKGTIEGYGMEILYHHMHQTGQHVPRSYSLLPIYQTDFMLTIY